MRLKKNSYKAKARARFKGYPVKKEDKGKQTKIVETPLVKKEVSFTAKCPVCKGKMARGNMFCSVKCAERGENETIS